MLRMAARMLWLELSGRSTSPVLWRSPPGVPTAGDVETTLDTARLEARAISLPCRLQHQLS
jgi:hypothetical protein